MATVKHKIFKKDRRADGSYRVKLIITHKGREVVRGTNRIVEGKQVSEEPLFIKDKSVIRSLSVDEKVYEDRIASIPLGRMKRLTAAQLADEILDRDISESDAPPVEVDFAAFIRDHMEHLIGRGKPDIAGTYRVVYNNLVDYNHGSDSFPATWITATMLRGFEDFLRTERKQTRRKRGGGLVTTTANPATDNGVFNIMRDLRALFNKGRKEFNTETDTVIKHQPFEFYKMPQQKQVRKKGEDISLKTLVKIRDAELIGGAKMARDCFMLSFYLCGMNAIDIYKYKSFRPRDKRITYERSKTRSRRKDNAMISMNIPDEARVLLEQYNGVNLQKRYSTIATFRQALKNGLSDVADKLKIPHFTFYHARHTFATLAHQRCGFSKEYIAAALNHVDQARAVTESYIVQDWSVVDQVQSGVLKLLSRHKVSD